MKIYCQQQVIEFKKNIKSLTDLKKYIKDQIQTLRQFEIFLVKWIDADKLILIEDHNFKEILSSYCELQCYPILDFLDLIYKRIKNEQQRQQSKVYQEEKQKLRESSLQTLEKTINIKPSDTSEISTKNTEDFIIPFTQSYIGKPKLKAQSLNEQMIQEIDERDSFQSRNFQTSFALTMISSCQYCKIVSKTNFINLSCFHQYHNDCLKEHIINQIKGKQTLIRCGCNKKIGKINQLFFSLTINKEYQHFYYNNQALELKRQYRFLKQCKNCEFFIGSQQNSWVESYCEYCNKTQEFI